MADLSKIIIDPVEENVFEVIEQEVAERQQEKVLVGEQAPPIASRRRTRADAGFAGWIIPHKREPRQGKNTGSRRCKSEGRSPAKGGNHTRKQDRRQRSAPRRP